MEAHSEGSQIRLPLEVRLRIDAEDRIEAHTIVKNYILNNLKRIRLISSYLENLRGNVITMDDCH